MAITVINPSVTKILLDLGIDPINPYDPENAEDTYMSAVREGINTIEAATGGKGDRRTRILRQEFQGLLSRKKGKKVVDVSKLLVKRSVVPTNKIRPQALLPPSQEMSGGSSQNNIIGGLLGSILKILQKDSKLEKLQLAEARKQRQRDRREAREKRVEKIFKGTGAAARAGQKVVDKLTSPFASIWKRLTEFLKFTVIGSLFNKALDWFGEEENQQKMGRVLRFLKFWWPSILAGYLAFFTPLGGLVTATVGFLTWALPALAGVITANPMLAAAVAAGGLIGWSAMEAEKRKEKIREDFNKTHDESITTVDEFKEENKNIKDPTKKKLDMSWWQGILELGSTPGAMNFNKGGVVPGSGNKDTVPAMLTPGEFVMSRGAVSRFGTGMMAAMNSAGGGTNKGGPMYEGGGLVGSSSMGGGMDFTPSTTPVKGSTSQKMLPVGTPTRTSITSTTTLPPINYQKPTHRGTKGTQTIPTFTVNSDSSYRSATMVALGIEAIL